jgi:hypothetical protein
MAATHQQHPHKSLQQFILDGEAELEHLEEPVRTIRAQSLFAELQRRFQPDNPIEIGDYTHPPSDKDVEDVVLQNQQDKLEEKEIEDGSYTHGDEGSGEPRFISHLRVKSVDNGQPFKQVFHRGPDVQVIRHIAVKPDPVELVSEGEIRVEERGQLDYKPTRPYHDRVSSWMFSLQYPAESRRARAKQQLICQRCEMEFEGRKGQKYCFDCGKNTKPQKVEEQHRLGECDCTNCGKVFDIFMETRLGHLLEKYEVKELTPDMELNEAEEQQILDFAKHMVEKQNEQQ